MRRRVQYVFSMVTLAALSGCGETVTQPIEPTAALDELAAQAVATAVVKATDARLPHLPSLVHEALEVVRSDDAQVEAATAFRRARRARMAAREAHEAGDEGEALRLLRRARRFTLEGVIAALGPGVVTEAIAGVEAAIAHWDERVSDRDVPERFLRALELVRGIFVADRSTLGHPDPRDLERSILVEGEPSGNRGVGTVELEAGRAGLDHSRHALPAPFAQRVGDLEGVRAGKQRKDSRKPQRQSGSTVIRAG